MQPRKPLNLLYTELLTDTDKTYNGFAAHCAKGTSFEWHQYFGFDLLSG
jgi:hypothetical protein